ncbi:MAG TPA: hypothetical protein VK791_07225 [bacterium]|jgi:hypothetical protein|nr:hypothetical protein [bacterium]
MRYKLAVVLSALTLSVFCSIPAYAVDESAADLVARGRLRLADITDAINKKYQGQKENYWDIANIAYHDFTGVPEVDVVVGLAGYHDKGSIYNDGKQVVEDAGAGFGYFHKEKDNWKLKQVELVRGKKYDGFEGADLIGLAKDQLVVYSSSDKEKIATVYMVPLNHVLKQIAVIVGKDFGPRVAQNGNKALMVDFRRALVKTCDGCQIYYGHAYRWQDHQFTPEDDDFLEAVEKYSDEKLSNADVQKGLTWFEDYLSNHPKDFCALANCYDLSVKLNLSDKAEDYKTKLTKLGMAADLNLKYCDQWLSDKNKAFQQQYLDVLEGKVKSSDDN